MSFDAVQFLDDYGIDHRTSGKNATRGWVQIHCPFSDCSDSSEHMGINVRSGVFHCWICDRRGPAPLLIARLLRTNYDNAKDIAKKYSDDIFDDVEEVRAERISVKGLLNALPDPHREYLLSRGFNPEELIKRYRIGAFGMWGRFPYRIAIPVYHNNRLVNLTARDITGIQEERYLSLKNEESVVSIKDCVYNIDSCHGDSILIVEGPFDVWRMGGATVSLFGTSFKTSQVMQILSKFPKNVFILFDAGADSHAEKLANNFTPFVKHVEILNIAEKDPACLSPAEALDIRSELGL